MTDELVTLEDVIVVSDGLVLICEYRGIRFGLPRTEMQPGTTIARPGDRGVLVVSRRFATDQRLV